MNPVRILIVEDDENFTEVALSMVQPIIKAFPGSTVTCVKTVEAALAVLAECVAPDITLLDLTLPPSGLEQTLAQLDSFEDRTAVVIVTGHKEEFVRKIIGTRETPIVEKTADLYRNPGPLMRAIYSAVDFYQKRKWGQQRLDLAILKRVTAHGPEE